MSIHAEAIDFEANSNDVEASTQFLWKQSLVDRDKIRESLVYGTGKPLPKVIDMSPLYLEQRKEIFQKYTQMLRGKVWSQFDQKVQIQIQNIRENIEQFCNVYLNLHTYPNPPIEHLEDMYNELTALKKRLLELIPKFSSE